MPIVIVLKYYVTYYRNLCYNLTFYNINYKFTSNALFLLHLQFRLSYYLILTLMHLLKNKIYLQLQSQLKSLHKLIFVILITFYFNILAFREKQSCATTKKMELNRRRKCNNES